MISGFKVFRPASIGKTETRKHCDDFATFAFVAAIAATRLPNRSGHILVNMPCICLFGIDAYFNDLLVPIFQAFNAVHNVTHLGFNQ